MSDRRGLFRWEGQRLAQYGTAVVVFGYGAAACLYAEAGGVPSVEVSFGGFLFAGLLGACVAADGNAFDRRDAGPADLAYLLTRPVGRLTLLRRRMATVALAAAVVGTPAVLRALARGTPAGGWLGDGLMMLAGYGAIALMALGMMTEPRIPLRARMARRSFKLKMAPLGILLAAMWAPVLAHAVDTSRASPADWWWAHAPVLAPLALAGLGLIYCIGLTRDWAQAEVMS